MRNYNIDHFQTIIPMRGGVRSSKWTLGIKGNFRINKFAMEENNLDKDNKFVEIKAEKKDDTIVVALYFSDDKNDMESPFSVSYYKSKDGKNKSLSFSGKSIFTKFELNINKYVKDKSITLKPEIQEYKGKRYFIIEIQLR